MFDSILHYFSQRSPCFFSCCLLLLLCQSNRSAKHFEFHILCRKSALEIKRSSIDLTRGKRTAPSRHLRLCSPAGPQSLSSYHSHGGGRGSSRQEADSGAPRAAPPTPVLTDSSGPDEVRISEVFPCKPPRAHYQNPLLRLLHSGNNTRVYLVTT